MLTDHIHDSIGKYRIGAILEAMPEHIKVAHDKLSSEDLSSLPDNAFAYKNGTDRYFPIHTPEHTYLSAGYFEKCASEFNEKDVDKIKNRINDAKVAFGIEDFSIEFSKEASSEDDIDYLHKLSQDIHDFITHLKKFEIEERRVKAKDLMHRAALLKRTSGMPSIVTRYGGDKLSKDYAQAFALRMAYFKEHSPERISLLNLQDQAHEMIPEKLAKTLAIFDKKFKLHKHYDSTLSDPYCSILEHGLLDEKPIHTVGEHSLYPSELEKFNFDGLKDLFEDQMVDDLKSHPHKIFGLDPSIKVMIIKRIKGL